MAEKIDIVLEKLEAFDLKLQEFQNKMIDMEIKADKCLTLARSLADKMD